MALCENLTPRDGAIIFSDKDDLAVIVLAYREAGERPIRRQWDEED